MQVPKAKKRKYRCASSHPCRFCGSPYNYVFKTCDIDEIDILIRIICAVCGAQGPPARTKIEAIKAWEHHAQPIPIAVAEVPEPFRDDDQAAGSQ